jgi:hypothetical protein
MKLRLLKLAARRPLAALAVVVVAPVIALAGAILAARAPAASPQDNPRAVLGRVWFDRYPDKITDEAQVWIWLGGGIGLHERGSYFRRSLDIFEFERQGDKLDMTYLQDKKKVETRFSVTRCDDKAPFDLCLDLTTSLGGHKRYYGFGDLDDMEARIPGSKSLLRAAEARATVPRR